MKRSIYVFWGALLTVALIAACAPAFEPELETNYTRQAEVTARYSFTIAATTSGNLIVQPSMGTIDYQKITITTTATPFDNSSPSYDFNLVITNRSIPGINVYTVGNGTTATDPYIHGTTPLDYTAGYKTKNSVELLLPFPANIITTTKVVVFADPALVLFKGDGKLNTDLDIEPGEGADKGNEDIYLEYLDVAPNTSVAPPLNVAALTGIPHPIPSGTKLTVPATFSFPSTGGLNIENGTKLEISTFSDSTGTTTNLVDAADLAAAYKFEYFDHTAKAWVAAAPSATLESAAKTLALTFPAAKLYSFYRYQVDLYQIAEKNAVQGYIHRASYDQFLGYGNGTVSNEWIYPGLITNKAAPDVILLPSTSGYTITPYGKAGAFYIDVDIPNVSGANSGTTDLQTATLTKENIRLFYFTGTIGSTPYGEIDLSNAVFEKLKHQQFRINLPSSFVRLNSGNARIQARIHDVQVTYKTGLSGSEKTFPDVPIFDPSETDGSVVVNSTANFPAP